MTTAPTEPTGDPEQRRRLQAALGDAYELRELVGRGGFAEVYAAWDVRLKRPVAVKALRPELIHGPRLRERFRREAEAAAKLRHPHIVPIYAVGERDETAFFTMPLVEGESLAAVVERQEQLPVPDVVRIVRQAAEALAAAHEAGLVHRDIKPDNIMLEGRDRHVLLMDFGISRAMDQDEHFTASGIVVGTLAYMSPEQARGGRDVDHRADIYALGLVGYQLLVGRLPSFLDETSTQMGADLRASRPGVSPAVAAVLQRCLRRNPAERWQSAAELVRALEQVAAEAAAPGWRRALTPRRVVAGLVALTALCFLLIEGPRRLRRTAPRAAPAGGVAVLYFANLSGDSADDYLAQGLAEEITARLGAVTRLQVKSRSAVRHAERASSGDPAALGRALGVRYLVEGSVRRAGRRVRVGVSLVTAEDGFRVWGEEYERSALDLLELQQAIATEVATRVTGRLLPAEQVILSARPTVNLEAYDRFLRGNHALSRRSPAFLRRAVAEYETAERLDPAFTQASARVALTYGLIVWWGFPFPGAGPGQLLDRGLAAVDRILRRDSTVAEAWLARGTLLSMRHPSTFEGVFDAFERALAIEPNNAEILQQYAWVFTAIGRDSTADSLYRRALALDPIRSVAYSARASHVELLARRYRRTIELADSALALGAAGPIVYAYRSQTRLAMGDTAGARADAVAALRISPPDYAHLAEGTMGLVDVATGDTSAAWARVARMERALMNPARPHFFEAQSLGGVLVALGEFDRALDLFSRARYWSGALRVHLRFPAFDPIAADPRFARLMEELRPVVASPR